MLLKIVNGSVSYRENQILEEIHFELNEKDKVAIIGRNGCGKTTFLNALIHKEEIEEGIGEEKFSLEESKNITIGYLKQNAIKNDNHTLKEELLSVFDDLIKIEEKLKEQEEKGIKDYNQYENLLENYKKNGGYNYQKEIEKMINQFGFSDSKLKQIKEFSGGEKTKIALMKLLLSKPNILLLDEPTNHLDLDTIIWLENYLKNYPYAVVIVSHDRMFLDNIVNKVYEIEYGLMKKYNGNYTDYERLKKEAYEKELKDYTYQQKEIKRLKSIADRFRYKPTKAKMALSKLKKIEQMTIIEKPTPKDSKKMKLKFQVKEKSGDVVLTLKNLEIGYTKTLRKVSFVLHCKERLAIIGPNGSGKSTLLKTIIGIIPKIKGSISFGYHVKASYFDQQMNNLDSTKTVLEEITKSMNKKEEEARTFLGRFLFTNEDVKKKVENLSGGEKVRLSLAKILSEEPNLLILDEPTNHLDILGKEVLEECLQNYEGTIILVSHDRYFISKIADSFLLLEEEPIYLRGTFKEVEERRKNEFEKEIKKEPKKKEKKEDIKEEKTRKKIEKEIKELEKEVKEIEESMCLEENYLNYKKMKELEERKNKINHTLEEKLIELES